MAESGPTGGISDSASHGQAAVFAFNVVSIPDRLTGVFGSWGLGWRMEPWPGSRIVEFASTAVFIGLASLGFPAMCAPKATMTFRLVAPLYVLPLCILAVGLSVVSENV